MWVVLRPISTKREGDAHGSLFERKILVKSPEPEYKAQRMVDYKIYYAITMRRNYHRKLSQKLSVKIISENYDLVYQSRRKVEIYRDTGVSKNRLYKGHMYHYQYINKSYVSIIAHPLVTPLHFTTSLVSSHAHCFQIIKHKNFK